MTGERSLRPKSLHQGKERNPGKRIESRNDTPSKRGSKLANGERKERGWLQGVLSEGACVPCAQIDA
ncbi:predicted protein [Plenodomus lingam JN3]|uniref:Predicted protein n=1 Tax=Leptosphaeria maculans (strain JN3 / isolate v23.1.3 / race Av1-4-5-6-7-8) TaxID=985895 RepID=E5R4K0_LEPMJ|nr:predicted protein [Plenodomus lingam JN3]CBX91968.1 predicted protein [Plenodomus lingam JN3]